MKARHGLLLALVLAACDRARPPGDVAEEAPRAVPGVETAVVVAEDVRPIVEGFAAVAAEVEAAAVRDARASVAEAEARLRLAQDQVTRLDQLVRGGIAPRKELEAARAEEATARAGATRARAILASFGGDVAGGGQAPRGPWIIAQLAQADALAVGPDAPARFRADALPAQEFQGRVDAAPTYVDAATRTAPVRLRVDDPGQVLLPGMTGSVAIESGEPRRAPVVPADAIVYDEGRPVVFVAGEAGRYTARPVEMGIRRGERIEIRAGLEPGTRIATTGAASLVSEARLGASGGDD